VSGGGASYPALFRLAVEALTSFSDVPLNLASYVGAGAAALSALAGATLLVLTVLGAMDASISLWILVAVLFISGVQLMFIGILGRYLAHVHDQVVGRPLYLVSRVVGARDRQEAGRP
jgi:dolichol-phosphate mannosyltransferase